MATEHLLVEALEQTATHGQNLLGHLRGTSGSNDHSPVIPQNTDLFRQSSKKLAEAATQLLQLAQDPRNYLEHLAENNQNLTCLRWLVNLHVLEKIPLQGQIAYTKLASLAGVPEQQLKSVSRMAITYGFLSEPEPNHISHSRNSALLIEDESFMNWARFLTNYSVPTSYKFPNATQRWGQTEAKNETAYQLAMGIQVPFFDHLRSDQALNGMFSSYMRNVASTEGASFKHLANGFDWAALPQKAKVVDVGGSAGHASLALAEKYPHLNFVVQDLPETLANASKHSGSLHTDAPSRMSFMPHDFFQPQPIQDADIYLLRMIIHDWPHGEALKILKHMKSAMKKPGARILVMDTVLPQPSTIPALEERQLRVRDLTMMQVFNAKEREVEDWQELAQDAGLRIEHIEQPAGSSMAVIQLVHPETAPAINGAKLATDSINHYTADDFASTNGSAVHASGDAQTLNGFGSLDAKDNSNPVLIIGAGIGGLCLAQGLKKAGVDFRVFERDLSESHRPQGYRLKLESDAAEALRECLPDDVFETFLKSCAINTFGETDYDPISGVLVKSRAGGGLAGQQGLRATFTVDRTTFRRVLMTGIKDQIVFGKALSSYSVDEAQSTTSATFTDGSHLEGSYLIGADGTRSIVRKQHLPELKYVDTGAVCIYGKTPITPELVARFPGKGLRWMTVCTDTAPLVQSILIGESPLTLLSEPIRFDSKARQRTQLPDDYVYWVLIGRKEVFEEPESRNALTPASDTSGGQQSAKHSLSLTQEWDTKIRSLFELQDTQQCSTLRVVSAKPEIPAWTPSRHVTLLGDAIHAMSPCGGVGANTALRDASELVSAFRSASGAPTAENIGMFEDGMRKRAFKSLMRSYIGSQRMFDQRPFNACEVSDF